ncbi:MAG: Asp-tRNA(Asn)/Glu-tRNA(Gln) amidotransferase subunit GatB [Gammaproteobacteria bacterium]|nr:Asp-tRNA(Asn)/Glu-tRNA(Gln) amidotransferase subunit GatB [Gammaproteobacteria bacterium]
MKWETVIGLEVHIQLKTKSKIFSGASTTFGADPNTQACLIDLGYPGVLPVLNKEAVNMAIKFGLATFGSIQKRSIFARKNYFYPDLPKGYQISQNEFPIIGEGGYLEIESDNHLPKKVRIRRAHLEEDAGKSLHEDFHGMTGLDFNRAGVPLLEIVSEPDMRSAKETVAYLKSLHTLVRYLDICDANMQEGSFRCDVNVSVRPEGETVLGTRTEIKNLNSFRFVEKAILYEVQRQINCIESGHSVTQQTMLYDVNKNETRPMRIKETLEDYRYFAEPDLLPLVLTDEMISKIQKTLPELPHQKQKRFINNYGLPDYDAKILVTDQDISHYFEEVVKNSSAEPKLIANWIIGDLSGFLNRHKLTIQQSPISPKELSVLMDRIQDKTISGKIAKEIFEAMWHKEGSADMIIEKKGLKQITNLSEIEEIVRKVLQDHPTEVTKYRSGQERLLGFFVGEVMKATKGKANPKLVNEILLKTVRTGRDLSL